MTLRSVCLPAILFLAVLLAGCGGAESADLVLRNGTLVTVDDREPEAEALAVVGDRIVAVGSNAEVDAYVGPETEVIDLDGKLAVPGFIEGHGHFMSLGDAQTILDLTQAETWDDVVQMVADAAAAAESGTWIRGRGWHQEKWTVPPSPSVEGTPVHDGLSAVSSDHPVLLKHASGHASFVNAAALEAAGITADTEAPPGGEIVRTADGRPTGMLRENAQDAVEAAFAASQSGRTAEEVAQAARDRIRLAGEEALSKGVTSFHDAGSSFEQIDRFKQMAEAGDLPLRLYVMVRYESNEAMDAQLPAYRMVGHADHYLTVRSIKRQIDGALGAHGAWLLAPYDDLPQSAGLNLEPIDEIARTAEIALKHGFQLNTHAIGDRANREVLDLYEAAFREQLDDPTQNDLRWRIEHAQHLHPDDIPRFGALNVIAAMQAIHCTSDAPYVVDRLGEERAAAGAYMWKDLWETGALVTNGTDAPVEDVDPIASFYATVTRRLDDGATFYPEQALTREQALASYTLNNAVAAFEEDLKGSLTPGKLADIAVLSANIMTVPAEEIPSAEVTHTILGGEVVYRRGVE